MDQEQTGDLGRVYDCGVPTVEDLQKSGLWTA